ncbi:MAG: ABC transporter permease [Halobacteriovoraceae bacterium]|jgi:putative ABC transport system permease protein|nr:ABC transporter permease [Halobacteriovoraceae bacterium]
MKTTIIPLSNLAISFIPVLFVLGVFIKWELNWKSFSYACLRMISQLLIVGYFLSHIFKQNSFAQTMAIVLFMLIVSGWISLYSIKNLRTKFLKYAFIALFCGSLPVLMLVTMLVIPTEPWYQPAFLIPLAGMVFSSSMNTIGLASERFEKEKLSFSAEEAKKNAFKAALIPLINTFFAVGLVSLPGMMTGQILSGVSPLLAVRYQIVVMTMVMGAGGISAAIFLYFRTKYEGFGEE